MGKVFLKLWLLLLLTSVTSFLIQREVFDASERETEARVLQEAIHRRFVMVEEALRPYPSEEWAARAEIIQKRTGLPSSVQKLESLAFTGDLTRGDIEMLSQGQLLVRAMADDTGRMLYRRILDTDYVGVLVAPARPEPLVWGVVRPIAVTWIVDSGLFALVLLLWLRFFWRDMRKVDAVAEKVGAGQFNVNVQLGKTAALRPIADSFNRMAERIGKLVNSHRDLTNAVSHELKTPLARLRFALSLTEDAATSAERSQLLKKMHQDVDELDALVQEMLLYSRLERNAAAPEMALHPVPVESWLPNAVEDETEAAEANDIRIPVAVESAVADAACEPKYMARAVQNLVRNALRYAKTRVEVSVGESFGRYWIHVDDDGPGIPMEDRARLFVPFARMEQSRARHADGSGTGLGLAIVQRIAEWHGGRAAISTSTLGGTRVTIEWPQGAPTLAKA